MWFVVCGLGFAVCEGSDRDATMVGGEGGFAGEDVRILNSSARSSMDLEGSTYILELAAAAAAATAAAARRRFRINDRMWMGGGGRAAGTWE